VAAILSIDEVAKEATAKIREAAKKANERLEESKKISKQVQSAHNAKVATIKRLEAEIKIRDEEDAAKLFTVKDARKEVPLLQRRVRILEATIEEKDGKLQEKDEIIAQLRLQLDNTSDKNNEGAAEVNSQSGTGAVESGELATMDDADNLEASDKNDDADTHEAQCAATIQKSRKSTAKGKRNAGKARKTSNKRKVDAADQATTDQPAAKKAKSVSTKQAASNADDEANKVLTFDIATSIFDNDQSLIDGQDGLTYEGHATLRFPLTKFKQPTLSQVLGMIRAQATNIDDKKAYIFLTWREKNPKDPKSESGFYEADAFEVRGYVVAQKNKLLNGTGQPGIEANGREGIKTVFCKDKDERKRALNVLGLA
jgi:hypothetical protein